jgi:chromosome segregation ATPase
MVIRTEQDALLAKVADATSTVNVNTDGLETLQTSTNTKLDTLEATLTAIETDQAALEALLTAGNVDHAANEVLLTAIDADTNAMKVDLAALEVLQTATNSKLDTLEATLTAIETDIAAVEVLQTAVKNSNLSGIAPSDAILIDDTVAHSGPYFAITALEDAVVDISECDMSFIDDVADFTIPKGLTIYGTFVSIELDSGKVIAYTL